MRNLEESAMVAIGNIIDNVVTYGESVVGDFCITKVEILKSYPIDVYGTIEDATFEYLENKGAGFLTEYIKRSY